MPCQIRPLIQIFFFQIEPLPGSDEPLGSTGCSLWPRGFNLRGRGQLRVCQTLWSQVTLIIFSSITYGFVPSSASIFYFWWFSSESLSRLDPVFSRTIKNLSLEQDFEFFLFLCNTFVFELKEASTVSTLFLYCRKPFKTIKFLLLFLPESDFT